MRSFIPILALVLAMLVGSNLMAQSDNTLTILMRAEESSGLPEDSVIEVQLLDVSRMDAPATVLAEQRYRSAGFPARVELPYDPSRVDPRMSYSISVRVTSGDDVLLRTTSMYPVLTRGGSDSVEVALERSSTRAPDLSGSEWQAFEIGGRMFVGERAPTLTFIESGRFGLFAGCNNYTGAVEFADEGVTFPGTMAGTRMACPETRESLDRDVLDAVTAARGYSYDGERLVFTNEAGVPVIRFQKVE